MTTESGEPGHRYTPRHLLGLLAGLSSGAVATIATIGLALVVAVLSLSDAFPFLLKRVARRLPIMPPDQVTDFSSVWGVHFFAWALITFAAVHMVRGWLTRAGVAVAVLDFGVLVEIGQENLSALRSFERVDLLADLRGVIVGFTAAVCLNALRSQMRGNRHQTDG
jgi:hypothetical protein